MKALKLIAFVLILGLLSCVAIAGASTVIGAIYTKFNSTEWINYELDKQYTAVTVIVRSALTFNGTGSTSAKVAFTNDTGSTPAGIMLLFQNTGSTGQIYKIEGVTEVLIGTFTFENTANKTAVILTSGYVTVYSFYGSANQTKSLDKYAFGSEYWEYCRVKGASAYVATAGYMQVEIGAGAVGASDAVSEYMPMIISVACLSIAFGALGVGHEVKKRKG